MRLPFNAPAHANRLTRRSDLCSVDLHHIVIRCRDFTPAALVASDRVPAWTPAVLNGSTTIIHMGCIVAARKLAVRDGKVQTI
jgi:hypothetical protein